MKYEDEFDDERDELKPLLLKWHAPDLPVALDARVLASFRQQVAPRSKWSWFKVPIPAPWPMAATAALLLCAASWFVARRTVAPIFVASPLTAATRFVEVPVVQEKFVVQEKIITRVVYVSRPDAPIIKPETPETREQRRANLPSDLAGFRPVSEIKLEISAGGLER